jgi:hypothetical protein
MKGINLLFSSFFILALLSGFVDSTLSGNFSILSIILFTLTQFIFLFGIYSFEKILKKDDDIKSNIFLIIYSVISIALLFVASFIYINIFYFLLFFIIFIYINSILLKNFLLENELYIPYKNIFYHFFIMDIFIFLNKKISEDQYRGD